MKGLRPPPLPAGELALLVDDSELLIDDTPATPEALVTARTAAGSVETRVTGLTARGATGRELDVTFLSEVYLFAGFDLDVSAGGVFLPTYRLFELGERLELCFEFGEELVRVSAEVRWEMGDRKSLHQRPGFALFWVELEPEAARALELYCRSHPPRFYELEATAPSETPKVSRAGGRSRR